MIRLPGLTIITNAKYDAQLGMKEMYKRLAITRGEEVMKLEEIYCTEAKEYNLQVQYGERLAKDLDAVQAEFNDLDRRYCERVHEITTLQAENARLRMAIDSIKESIERTRA